MKSGVLAGGLGLATLLGLQAYAIHKADSGATKQPYHQEHGFYIRPLFELNLPAASALMRLNTFIRSFKISRFGK